MATLEEQWQGLCEELRAAEEALWDAMVPVIKAQADVARGASQNAPDSAYDALEAARERHDDVDRRMDEFIERHCRKPAV